MTFSLLLPSRPNNLSLQLQTKPLIFKHISYVSLTYSDLGPGLWIIETLKLVTGLEWHEVKGYTQLIPIITMNPLTILLIWLMRWMDLTNVITDYTSLISDIHNRSNSSSSSTIFLGFQRKLLPTSSVTFCRSCKEDCPYLSAPLLNGPTWKYQGNLRQRERYRCYRVLKMGKRHESRFVSKKDSIDQRLKQTKILFTWWTTFRIQTTQNHTEGDLKIILKRTDGIRTQRK